MFNVKTTAKQRTCDIKNLVELSNSNHFNINRYHTYYVRTQQSFFMIRFVSSSLRRPCNISFIDYPNFRSTNSSYRMNHIQTQIRSVNSTSSSSSAITTSSINERPSTSTTTDTLAISPLSTLLHTTFGIDHYPGYLLKFSLSQLDNYEVLLQNQLQLIQKAKTIVKQREQQLQTYTPLYTYTRENVLEWINKDLYQILSTISSSSSGNLNIKIGKIMQLITEESEGIYSFPLLSPEGCNRILEEINHFSQWEYQQSLSSSDSSSSSLVHNFGSNRRNIPLKACGLDIVQDILFENILQPLCTVVFPEISNINIVPSSTSESGKQTIINKTQSSLDFRYGYIIGYTDKQTAQHQLEERQQSTVSTPSSSSSNGGIETLLTRNSLRKHTDDSEVTVNINLGKIFTGGDLIFKGLRNTSQKNHQINKTNIGISTNDTVIHPELGKAIIHLGQHIHAVTPVETGERYNLILWSRSSTYRNITCPCCLIHRRTECICDTTWP